MRLLHCGAWFKRFYRCLRITGFYYCLVNGWNGLNIRNCSLIWIISAAFTSSCNGYSMNVTFIGTFRSVSLQPRRPFIGSCSADRCTRFHMVPGTKSSLSPPNFLITITLSSKYVQEKEGGTCQKEQWWLKNIYSLYSLYLRWYYLHLLWFLKWESSELTGVLFSDVVSDIFRETVTMKEKETQAGKSVHLFSSLLSFTTTQTAVLVAQVGPLAC